MRSTVPTDIAAFIDEEFSFAAPGTRFNVDMQFRDRTAALLRLVDELDPELMTFTGRTYSQYVGAVEGMRSTIQLWGALGPTSAHADRRLGDAIIKLRHLISQLNDSVIPSATAELTFIADSDLRDSIREDIAAADHAYSAREWKSATVMAGAAVEALLLWRIRQHPEPEMLAAFASLKMKDRNGKAISPDPDEWTLEIYRQVASRLKLIEQDADDLTKLAQQYRNLIHPGRARRKGRKCTRSTALTALAAMNRLIEEYA